MSEDQRHCPDCGGSNGSHYNDCIYDGTDGPGSYFRGSKGGSNLSGGKWFLLYIIVLVIGYGFNELLGTILLIGLIFWLCMCK